MKKSHPSMVLYGMALALFLAVTANVADAQLVATGGDAVYNIQVDGDLPYRMHVFTNTGPAMLSVSNSGLVEVLVVAGGGGGGGGAMSGGGGAGGVIHARTYPVVASNYTVTVGAGGLGGYAYNLPGQAGVQGEDSAFGAELIAVGGGGGGGWTGHPSTSGGSGGGGNSSVAASPGTEGQGHAGNIGSGTTGQRSGGGGGGAGAPGGLGLAGAGGKGGDGIAVFGDYYGGGGGGGLEGTPLSADGGGAGGLGGGGAGSKGSTKAMDAEPNTGGGGGGAGYSGSSTGRIGGNGGSGIVIVRYPLSALSAAEGFTLANIQTGSEHFTNTNKVNIAAFPVPDGYDQFQWTGEAGTLDAMDPEAWLPTNAISDLMAAPVPFTMPAADTNVMLYAWFTNTTDAAAPLMRAAGEIVYTTVAPVPTVHTPLTRFLVGDRSSIDLTLKEIDNGSTGGESCGQPIPIFGTPVISCPDDQTPDAPPVTLNAVGSFFITLTVTNEAGNVASAVSDVTVLFREADLYVSTNGNHSTGTDWASAYTNIQDALDAAVSNDTIHLAGQTFAVTNQLVWTNSFITIRGGYEADPENAVPGANDPEQWPTVITRNPAYNTRLLFVDAVEDVAIERITFTNGNIDLPNVANIDVPGGGAIAIRDASNFRLNDSRLTHNNMRNRSGGAYGGALHVLNATGVISNTFFMANRIVGSAVVGYGGGINISGGAVALHDVVFLGNRAQGEWAGESWRVGYGGGISFHGGNHTLHNALLFLNQARRHVLLTATEGSGIYVWNNATVAIANATVYGHSSEGLFIVSGNVTVKNSIFSHNNPDFGGPVAPTSLSHCFVGDGTGGGTLNILTGDPGFDEEWFYLASNSPCRNAGDDTVGAAGLTGYTVSTNGAPEAAGATVSMGYHYAPGAALAPMMEYYVSETGDDDNPGDAAHPYRTIARALQAPGERVRIHLLPGEHASADDFPVSIENRGTVQIMGADPETTFIDGKNVNDRRLFEIRNAYGNNLLHGVTLRNGGGTVEAMDGIRAGGAIFLGRARLTIEDCIVTNNRATVGAGASSIGIQTLGGGAIGAKQAVLDIRGTRFAGNTTLWGSGGGAILAHAAVGNITDCVFHDNRADAQTGPSGHNRSMTGGAIHLARSSINLQRCLFTQNKAISHRSGSSAGGALFHCDGKVTVRNCLFADNQLTNNYTVSPLYGSAIYQFNPGASFVANRFGLVLANDTIARNYGDGNDYGHGVFGHDDYLEIVNTILWENHPSDFTNLSAAAFSYSRADELIPGEQGNITSDPSFVDTTYYHLRSPNGNYVDGYFSGGRWSTGTPSSPCIAAGDPESDFSLEPQPNGGRINMGAYGNTPVASRFTPSGSLFLIR